MRLTLRTILAYLDDVLEPAQARELGEKIAESPEATAMVARIRDVMRRRRIGAPELAGPGSGPDPNLVSDYLENILPADQVVELERLCQNSDVHLAEVAASHKILSMVVGHPLDVADEMRERMYALGSSKATSDTPSSPALTAMADGMARVETDTEHGLPEYLTRRSWAQQYGPLAAIAACTLIWIALVWTDSALWTQPAGYLPDDAAVAVAQPAAPVVPPGGNANLALNQRGDLPPQNPLPAAAPLAPPLPEALVVIAPGNNVPALAPAAMPAAPAPGAEVPVPPAPAMPAGALPPPLPPAAVPMTLPESPLVYRTGDEFVIKKLAAQPDWMIYPISIGIEVDDEFASPVPFRNTYGIADVIDVGLEPGTRVQRLPRTEQTTLGLLLNRGRLIFYRPLTTAQPVALQLLAGGRQWTLTLLEPGTKCVADLTLPVPQGILSAEIRLSPQGGLAVVTGRVRVSATGLPDLELSPESGMALWPADASMLVLHAELGTPEWARQEELIVTPAAKQLARLYQKEFIADRTIAQCIGPVVSDRRAGISELAVKTLAMIDQYPFLVPALESDHQETRLAAIDGLRQWLGQDAERGEQLKHELGQVFRDEYVGPLTRLLWGFNDQDARNPEISRQLIDWMKDDQIAVRQLAFEYVSRIVGKTYDYLPMAPPAERRAAISRWEEYLKRSGGTLLPAAAKP